MTVAPDFLSDLPGVIAANIHADLPGLRTCEAIAGEFDVNELKRAGTAAPAVLVAVLGGDQVKSPAWPQLEFHLNLAAFVVTRNRGSLTGQDAAFTIAQQLLELVPEQRWAQPDAGPADKVTWRNLVTKETRAQQVTLAVVSWRQPVTLLAEKNPQPIPIDIYYSQAPEIGAANQGAYTHLDPAGAGS